MYVKLFASIFQGSLYGRFEPTVTFIAMLALAEKDGSVDMTAQAIAARCGFPLEIVQAGIDELAKPDPESRTPDEEGRRIVLLNPDRKWGWLIVNYTKYRQIRTAEERREYMRVYKRQQRGTMSTTVHREQPIAYAEADSYAEAEAEKNKKPDVPLNLKGVDQETWDAWIAYRREHRLSVGHRALNIHAKLLRGYSPTIQRAIVESSIGSDWAGLFAPKGRVNGSHESEPDGSTGRSAVPTKRSAEMDRAFEEGLARAAARELEESKP